MSIIRGFHNLKPEHQGAVLTIGNFDGVHVGHQALIAEVTKNARALNKPSMVMIFEPQPSEFFSPDKSTPRLTRLQEKYYWLKHYGIQHVLVIGFDQLFAKITAEEFVKDLHHKLKVQEVIVGDDFKFGANRSGDFDFLKKEGERLGFQVKSISTVKNKDKRVSSTYVRELLKEGNLELAKALLGRPYSMMGRIVHGDKRGRILGFPTANINVHRSMTPVQGIYVVRMQGLDKTSLPGVANVGIRPTVGGTRTLLEVHLFDFDQEIYGRRVCVEFCKKLRDEERFANLELLKLHIQQDAEQAREYFERLKSNERL